MGDRSGGIAWLASFAAARGLRYEPEADERWLRAWEPFTTLKVPLRYEHALHGTGGARSVSIARAVVAVPPPAGVVTLPGAGALPEVGTWLAIVQDERPLSRIAVTNDFAGLFGEPLDFVGLPRRATHDPAFDHAFAAFARTDEELAEGLSPSLRRLLLSWRIPVHAETRPGGFILAPLSVSADAAGLDWFLAAIRFFGDKAQKRAT